MALNLLLLGLVVLTVMGCAALLRESSRSLGEGLDEALRTAAEPERLANEAKTLEVGRPVCQECGKHIGSPDDHDLTCWLYASFW